MEIKQVAKNGIITQAVKTYDELTQEELNILRIPATTAIEDYANFKCYWNKQGEVIRVVVGEFAELKREEIKAHANEPTWVDVFKVAQGKHVREGLFTNKEREAIKIKYGAKSC
ncbi:hypothetical protein [Veillonella caviae]|uniref:hypothetical protein n=1 Tax=Veillonella caviae TaxID=248316 RepID=UPI000F8CE62F|nr:hypothetical protein [Veillonella caviae]MCI5708008.1 hypothetical protein [Veillonella caviae]MCI6407900.1 hypothetical protein [Veillonella caviae]MDY5408601.1 hypothetical protein [Veillonella caviae]MDY6224681.1 hypothetical protein [Veillonella caviae]